MMEVANADKHQVCFVAREFAELQNYASILTDAGFVTVY
jgi:hypothetical protein